MKDIEKTIKLNNKEIKYTIKNSKRAKNIRISINQEGKLIIIKPYYYIIPLTNILKSKAKWILAKLNSFNNNIYINNKEDYLKYKDEVYNLILKRIEYFNKIYNYKYNNIKIKNQKSRWGSCSSQRNLNFNYKIFFLKDYMQDYIIVHELCHLKEMNHSPKFWNLVSQTIPNYINIKREVRDYKILIK
tara:strand:- start:1 stop:564 length:564 start_codon:yes stop_codon:yes gene_type:complete